MSAETIARKWHDHLLSTEAVDHGRAEAAVRAAYRAAGIREPEQFLWCASPLDAAWATLVTVGKTDGYNHATLEDVERSKTGKSKLREVRGSVSERLGIPADQVEGHFGKPFCRGEGSSPIAKKLADDSIDSWMARAESGDDYLAAHTGGPFHALHQLEEALFFEGTRARTGKGSLYPEAMAAAGAKSLAVLALRSAQHRLYGSLAFIEVAMDEALAEAGKLEPTELQRAMWAAYEACGLWWPCERGVVLAARPVAAGLGAHGPRMEWADGFTVGGPPAAAARAPATAPAAPTAPLAPDQPTGATPFLDRYLAGEHETVWKELVALGDSVRTGPHAADALAVARETMNRVEQNLRTLAGRLHELGYRFVDPTARGGLFGLGKPKAHAPHVPPVGDAGVQVAALEGAAGGPIPLSLRAFYEVVGDVNFLGEHPTLAPRGSAIADPLFVHGVADAIACVESWDDDDQKMIVVAPDALHKANVSGGDPYMLAVPDGAADALLEEEPRGVTFVEYLRIAILGWGGFPGWEGTNRPPELDALREGLIPF